MQDADPRVAQQAANIDLMRRETDRNRVLAEKSLSGASAQLALLGTPPAGSGSDAGAAKRMIETEAERRENSIKFVMDHLPTMSREMAEKLYEKSRDVRMAWS